MTDSQRPLLDDVPSVRIPKGALRVVFHASGRMTTSGVDRRLLIQINGDDALGHYRSFVEFDGSGAEETEWASDGFYVLRNVYHNDAVIQCRYEIGITDAEHYKAGAGLSSVYTGQDGDEFFGFRGHGIWKSNSTPKKIRAVFDGPVTWHGNMEFTFEMEPTKLAPLPEPPEYFAAPVYVRENIEAKRIE